MAGLVLAASFTADLIAETLRFWERRLAVGVRVDLAAYGQVYQALLDPTQAMGRNRDGANIVCLRWQDLVGPDQSRSAYDAAAGEFSDAVRDRASSAPLLIVLCPEADAPDAARAASALLQQKTAHQPSVSVLEAQETLRLYQCTDAFDRAADKAGHVPYTPPAMAAIGSGIMRWWLARTRPPVKLIAADCDNTLWRGIVGEDGVDGIALDPGHLALQQTLKDQSANGRLVTLLSKNEEQDVKAVFEQRPDMVLSLDDIVSHRINWRPKPDNLPEMVEDIGLGLNTAIFLDDNDVEIAAMRNLCPSVQSIRIPQNADDMPRFLDHLWLLDCADVTAEDAKRTKMYKENARRSEAQQNAGSLAAFLETLELEVAIDSVEAESVPRFSQLTLRTNQFNTTLTRQSEQEVRHSLGRGDILRIVRAKDRFGDYGIVGALRATVAADVLDVDLFLLSCRALGRGVERQMVRALGEIAEAESRRDIAIRFEEGPRNTPVRAFLESLGTEKDATFNGAVLRLPTACAVSLDLTGASAAPVPSTPAMVSADDGPSSSVIYQDIAERLITGAAVWAEMTGPVRARPDLDTDYVRPGTPMEMQLAGIWQEVLNIDRVGSRDSFTALGGKSIQLVAVHGAIRQRLGLEIDLTLLFEHGTIESLAGALQRLSTTHERSGNSRAAKMRAARGRQRTRQRG